MNHDVPVSQDHPEPNITETAGLWLTIVIVIFFLILSAIGSYFYFKGVVSAEINRKEITGTPRELVELRIAEQEQLLSYGWVDKEKGIVKIPVDLAIELVVKEYNEKK